MRFDNIFLKFVGYINSLVEVSVRNSLSSKSSQLPGSIDRVSDLSSIQLVASQHISFLLQFFVIDIFAFFFEGIYEVPPNFPSPFVI